MSQLKQKTKSIQRSQYPQESLHSQWIPAYKAQQCITVAWYCYALSSTGKELSASESEPSATGQQVLSGPHFPRRMDLGVGHPVPASHVTFPSTYKLSLSVQTANKKPTYYTIQSSSLAMAASPSQDTELTSFTVHSSHEEFLSLTASRHQIHRAME